MPYQYWRNLVLGDPMLAPYAKRPKVAITGLTQGQVIGQSVHVVVNTTDAAGTGVAKVKLYLDGVLSGEVDGDTLDTCIDLPARDKVQVLAVAQSGTGTDALAKFPPKGWAMITVDGRGPGKPSCDAPLPDGGPVGDDAGGNGVNPAGQGGCSCDASGGASASSVGLAALVALALVRRRRSLR